jgi:hypothetical protein
MMRISSNQFEHTYDNRKIMQNAFQFSSFVWSWQSFNVQYVQIHWPGGKRLRTEKTIEWKDWLIHRVDNKNTYALAYREPVTESNQPKISVYNSFG